MPTYGFLSAAGFPVLVLLVIPQIYPAFQKTAIRLHLEAEAILRSKSRPNSPEATELHKVRAKGGKNNNKQKQGASVHENEDDLDASVADPTADDF